MAANSGFPANFTTRRELQTTVLRCNSLLRETEDKDLRLSLFDMAVSAATMDALLAEQKDLAQEDARFKNVYEGAAPWQYEWADSKCCVHTGRGLFFLNVGQQCIIMDGKDGLWVGCRRFRLQLGEPHAAFRYSSSLRALRPFAIEYIERFGEYLPVSEDTVLSVFMDDDIPEVRKHAVCQ